MKKVLLLLVCVFTGCASSKDQNLYYETVKSMNRDNTMAQVACWNAVTELSKSSDPQSKIAAVALSKECKVDPIQVQPPKTGLFQ